METHYQILGIKINATQSEIRAAFNKLIKESHPDINQGTTESTQRTVRIIEAYSVLKDENKRLEYNAAIANNNSSHTNTNTNEYDPDLNTTHIRNEAKENSTESPIYACESCGKTDVTLNYYIFAWVISIIVLTWHGETPLILCKPCRLKKAIIYTLQIFFLGWWGFPGGIIYSLIGIFQNISGGIYPRHYNAALLESHGYNLFKRRFFSEALESIMASQKLSPTPEKEKFIAYLKTVTEPGSLKTRIVRRVWKLNPAWLLMPILIYIVFAIVTNFINADSGYHQQYSAANTVSSSPSTPEADTLIAVSDRVKFDLKRFRDSVNTSNQVVAQVATYIHDHVPMVGTHNEGSTIVSDYVLDREKLSADQLDQFANTLRSNLEMASTQVEANQNDQIDSGVDCSNLKAYLTHELDFMRSCYYNVMILSISVRYYDQLHSESNIAPTVTALANLKSDPLLQEWFSRSGQATNVSQLNARLSNEDHQAYLSEDIEGLRADIKQGQQSIDTLKQSMNEQQTFGNIQAYNNLVAEYNDAINVTREKIRNLNEKVTAYNSGVQKLNRNSVLDAFDDCIDGRVLLTSFDKVDLKSKVSVKN